MTEAHLQNYVLERLAIMERQGKGYAFRNNKPGMPDIVACLPGGRFLGLELKSEKGRQSPEQKQAQASIEALGGLYALLRTPEEFEGLLKGLA